MSRADQDKWDRRYHDGAYAERTHPSAFLAAMLPRLSTAADEPRAIDIACGAGRNALYLAKTGWHVDAIDVSQVALDQLAAKARKARLSIACTQADLDASAALRSTAAEHSYELAIMMRYTNLPLIAALRPLLREGGYLVVELHLQTDANVVGPRNPRFRVAPDALLEAAAGFDIIDYREGLVDEVDGRIAALAQLFARVA